LPDVLAEVGRDLAAVGTGSVEQQAIVLRLGTGPERLAADRLAPPHSVVGLLAA
jgi:hypothetical protein